MIEMISLSEAVDHFALVTQNISDADLERPWSWGEYDSEGIRFAHFRVYEDLRALTVKVLASRAVTTRPITQAQSILLHYQVAFNDLHAVLLGLPTQDRDTEPAEHTWSIRQTYTHIAGADVGFYVAIQHALERIRAGDVTPTVIPDAVWDDLIGMDETSLNAIMCGPWSDLISYHKLFHQRILNDFSGIADAELEVLSKYWENQPMSIRFRLGRLDSHMRQHTIQIEKTRYMLGHSPREVVRLLRLIYTALGEAEGVGLGVPEILTELEKIVVQSLIELTDEVQSILQS